MLTIKNLRKRYGNFQALDGLNLEVADGELFGFVGPNGAGKTTTLKILAGLLVPDEGVQSGHFGSALAAAGELAWRRGNYDQAIGLLEKALMVTQSRFGESDACAVIRQNLEMIKKEKEEKGITGAADKKEDKGGNLSHCASCQFKDAKF